MRKGLVSMTKINYGFLFSSPVFSVSISLDGKCRLLALTGFTPKVYELHQNYLLLDVDKSQLFQGFSC